MPEPREPKVCIECGGEMTGKRSHARYCSQTCANRYNRRARTPRQERARNLWKTYKITPEDFAALVASQGDTCAICQTTDNSDPRWGNVWHVDHCHETGVVRGLLCSRCNRGIGLFLDRVDLLKSAAAYLRRTEAVTCTTQPSPGSLATPLMTR